MLFKCRQRNACCSTKTLVATNGNDDVIVIPDAPLASWPELCYHQTDEVWQREKCRQLGLRFHCAPNFQRGGRDIILCKPDETSMVRIRGDGNCLFRAFSFILTGSESQHFKVRKTIVAHMRTISHLLEGSPHTNITATTIEKCIARDQRATYGTEAEMLTFAHLLQCNMYSFNPTGRQNWFPVFSHHTLTEDVGQQSLYISWTNNNHFDVVAAQV